MELSFYFFANYRMNKRTINYIWLTSLLVFPIVLWILPGDFFDNGTLVLCPSKLVFGLNCSGCGLTRATMHIHHLQFDQAYSFNVLSFLFYPFLVYLWFRWLIIASKSAGLFQKSQIS